MLKTLYILSLGMLLIECRNSISTKMERLEDDKGTDTTISFSIINKDIARLDTYHYDRKSYPKGVIAFNYIRQGDTFSVICDTPNKKYKAQFDHADTIELDVEKLRYYTINGIDFEIIKLIAEKNVTDASFSLFISPEFGLLINKSNTWRVSTVLCPRTVNKNYLQLIVLLYRVQTDIDFFPNPIPDINKFKTPVVE